MVTVEKPIAQPLPIRAGVVAVTEYWTTTIEYCCASEPAAGCCPTTVPVGADLTVGVDLQSILASDRARPASIRVFPTTFGTIKLAGPQLAHNPVGVWDDVAPWETGVPQK